MEVYNKLKHKNGFENRWKRQLGEEKRKEETLFFDKDGYEERGWRKMYCLRFQDWKEVKDEGQWCIGKEIGQTIKRSSMLKVIEKPQRKIWKST